MKKNNLIILLIVVLVTFLNFTIFSNFYNNKLIDITNNIIKEYPEIDKYSLAKTLKSSNEAKNNSLENFGYKKNDIYMIPGVIKKLSLILVLNIGISILLILILNFLNKNKNRKLDNEINELIEYLDQINNGNYNIDLNKYNESKFSKLRNSIYKTTVILKEYNDYLNNDKLTLKNNIADISHQLKTPLTSSSLMLETLLDKEIDDKKREEYINKIIEKNEKINYLINVLLKLSKLETSTIEFKQEEVLVKILLEKVINSTHELTLSNNVKINLEADNKTKIKIDSKWQEEALSNILKNCIEHSKMNGIIKIKVKENNFFTEINIKDNGEGIKKIDLPKIFNRFYKTENSKGAGIGLNLAKTIIEKDNGVISVDSKLGEYTVFKIKYLKK